MFDRFRTWLCRWGVTIIILPHCGLRLDYAKRFATFLLEDDDSGSAGATRQLKADNTGQAV